MRGRSGGETKPNSGKCRIPSCGIPLAVPVMAKQFGVFEMREMSPPMIIMKTAGWLVGWLVGWLDG